MPVVGSLTANTEASPKHGVRYTASAGDPRSSTGTALQHLAGKQNADCVSNHSSNLGEVARVIVQASV